MKTRGTLNRELISARDAFFGEGGQYADDSIFPLRKHAEHVKTVDILKLKIAEDNGDLNEVGSHLLQLTFETIDGYEEIYSMSYAERLQRFEYLQAQVEAGRYNEQQMEKVERYMAALLDVSSAYMVPDDYREVECNSDEMGM